MRPGQLEEHLVYPVTTETTDHPGGYQGAIDEFYERAAELLAGHLAAGRTVALLAAGDPLFYSSYMHMHRRLADRFPAEIIRASPRSVPPPPRSAHPWWRVSRC